MTAADRPASLARPTPPHQLPLARLPVVPRPRRHEPGGSYLVRLAAANAMDSARLTRLLGPRRAPKETRRQCARRGALRRATRGRRTQTEENQPARAAKRNEPCYPPSLRH